MKLEMKPVFERRAFGPSHEARLLWSALGGVLTVLSILSSGVVGVLHVLVFMLSCRAVFRCTRMGLVVTDEKLVITNFRRTIRFGLPVDGSISVVPPFSGFPLSAHLCVSVGGERVAIGAFTVRSFGGRKTMGRLEELAREIAGPTGLVAEFVDN